MGIVISKENFADLNEKASKRFDKKTAECITRNLCRALSMDERWIKLNASEMLELSKEHGFELPSGNFGELVVSKSLAVKRENNVNYRFYTSKTSVVKGWHSATIAGLINEGVTTEGAVAGFVFEIGQKIIKSNNPHYGKKSKATA